VKVLCRLRHVM